MDLDQMYRLQKQMQQNNADLDSPYVSAATERRISQQVLQEQQARQPAVPPAP